MTCERMEALLPAYADHNLPEAEAVGVKAHLEGCASCKEALNWLTSLDAVLKARSSERPSAQHTARMVMSAIRPSRARMVLDAVFSLPVMVSAFLIAMGIVFFIHINKIRVLVSPESPVISSLIHASEQITSSILDLGGGDLYALITIYAGVIGIILLTTSLVAYRFIRDPH
jgi:anti-sigma factor RsiW